MVFTLACSEEAPESEDTADGETPNSNNGSETHGGSGGSSQTTTGNATSSQTNGTSDTTSNGAGGGGEESTAATGNGNATTGGNGTSSAKEVAAKLGRDHFLIGMGNDLAMDHNEDGAYTLGVTLDLHYAYLVGLLGQGGWPDWNPGGSFVNVLTDAARNHGVVPMFTLYSMAAQGEGNAAALTDPNYMRPYWEGAKLMFERLAVFGDPAVVHFEPDFWAFTQQQVSDPSQMQVLVGSIAADCEDQPDTMVGMGHCLVKLAREYAPQVLVGFHASAWANPDPGEVSRYLKDIGAGTADLVVIETLDRDAGCFEAGVDPNCQRGGAGWYWDEAAYHEHFTWAKAISDDLGKPLLWWQMPFGVPSDTPGGEAGKYRDNKVKYLFEHMDEFVAAGGVGAAFGTGAGNQTYINSDGDQFRDAVSNYYVDPHRL